MLDTLKLDGNVAIINAHREGEDMLRSRELIPRIEFADENESEVYCRQLKRSLEPIIKKDLKEIILEAVSYYLREVNPKPTSDTFKGAIKKHIYDWDEAGRIRAINFQQKIRRMDYSTINLTFNPDERFGGHQIQFLKDQFYEQKKLFALVYNEILDDLQTCNPATSTTSKRLKNIIMKAFCRYYNVDLTTHMQNIDNSYKQNHFNNMYTPVILSSANLKSEALDLVAKKQKEFESFMTSWFNYNNREIKNKSILGIRRTR